MRKQGTMSMCQNGDDRNLEGKVRFELSDKTSIYHFASN